MRTEPHSVTFSAYRASFSDIFSIQSLIQWHFQHTEPQQSVAPNQLRIQYECFYSYLSQNHWMQLCMHVRLYTHQPQSHLSASQSWSLHQHTAHFFRANTKRLNPHLLEVLDDILMWQFLLLQLHLERTLVFAQVHLLAAVAILCQFQRHRTLCLQLCDVVLMLVQQVLHLLFVDLMVRDKRQSLLQILKIS